MTEKAGPVVNTDNHIDQIRSIIADHCFGPHATPEAEERALNIASACTDDMIDAGLLPPLPTEKYWRDRSGDLWKETTTSARFLTLVIPGISAAPQSFKIVERSWGPLVPTALDDSSEMSV